MTQAVVFDLFDTLVDLRREDLPRLDAGEGPVHSTLGPLLEVVRRRVDVSAADLVAALRAADDGYRSRRWRQDLEIHTVDRFASLLLVLGLRDDALARELASVHLAWLTRVAHTPEHHPEVLRALRERCRLAICSNFSSTSTARAILERDGLLDLFDVVVVSEEVGLRKPRREIFESALEGLGVAAGQALHVGDQLAKDVAGAAPLGIRTVWLTRRVPDPAASRSRYAGPPPDHQIADLREIEGLLDGR